MTLMSTEPEAEDWYSALAAGWAERQRREDERWYIPPGGLFTTYCSIWIDGVSRPCPQIRGHTGKCGLPPDKGPEWECRRGCPDGECYCPMPGDVPINPACGHLRTDLCDTGCGVCTRCDGCYCAEVGPFWAFW